MSATTHTPGPWAVERSLAGKTVITGPGGAHTLAVVAIAFDGAGGLSSMEANAHLIAAAPELLAACIAAEETLDNSLRSPERADALELLRAAIAKAGRGR